MTTQLNESGFLGWCHNSGGGLPDHSGKGVGHPCALEVERSRWLIKREFGECNLWSSDSFPSTHNSAGIDMLK